MSRLVLAACVGAAAYVLLRPPRDDPLDDFEYAAPSARAAPPPAPPPVAAKPPEPAPVPALPVQSRNPAEPIDALLLGILRFVGVQIFISVLVVLAVSLFLGAENGRTVGIGAFGIFSVFTFSALAQMRLQVQRRQLVPQRSAAPLQQKLPPPAAPAAPRPSPFAERASTMTALEAAEAMIASMGGAKPPPPPQDLTGSWDKDKTLSDSMEPVMVAMQLNALVRKAVSTAKGVRIRMDSQQFEMTVLSSILWFKVTERYPWSGEECRYKRRDLRRGSHAGSVAVTQQGHVKLKVRWGDPLGGSGTDVFHSPAPDLLHVDSTIHLRSGKTLFWRTVYRRRQ